MEGGSQRHIDAGFEKRGAALRVIGIVLPVVFIL